MTRIVTHREKGPVEIKPVSESKWVCRCGLSRNQPYCDGSHKRTLDEGEDKLYAYDDEARVEIKKI